MMNEKVQASSHSSFIIPLSSFSSDRARVHREDDEFVAAAVNDREQSRLAARCYLGYVTGHEHAEALARVEVADEPAVERRDDGTIRHRVCARQGRVEDEQLAVAALRRAEVRERDD